MMTVHRVSVPCGLRGSNEEIRRLKDRWYSSCLRGVKKGTHIAAEGTTFNEFSEFCNDSHRRPPRTFHLNSTRVVGHTFHLRRHRWCSPLQDNWFRIRIQ